MGNGNEDDSSVAQWARDPSGRHVFRHWDGERWTGHVSDKRTMPIDPPKELAEHPPTPAPRPPRLGESGPHPPVPTLTTEAAGAGAGAVAAAGAGAASVEHPESRLRSHRRQTARRRRAFLLGLLTGVALVAAAGAAAYAVLDLHVSTGSTSTASRHRSTTSTSVTPSTAATTTTTVNPGRPPQQVHLRIINASQVANAASNKAFALGGLGYPVTGLADGPVQQGTVVECKPGFEAEAATLAKNVGPGTTVQPFPTPAPAGSANADCVVILGK
jgi:Protein of unknown function (DUF2510)